MTHSFKYALASSIKVNHKVNEITDLNDRGAFVLFNGISNQVQLAEKKLSRKKNREN